MRGDRHLMHRRWKGLRLTVSGERVHLERVNRWIGTRWEGGISLTSPMRLVITLKTPPTQCALMAQLSVKIEGDDGRHQSPGQPGPGSMDINIHCSGISRDRHHRVGWSSGNDRSTRDIQVVQLSTRQQGNGLTILDGPTRSPVWTTQSLSANPIGQGSLIIVDEQRLIDTLHAIRKCIELCVKLLNA